MKKLRNQEWEQYRHPEFLDSLNVSVNELKYIRLFLKRGTVDMVNEMLRERKTKQNRFNNSGFATKFQKRERIKI